MNRLSKTAVLVALLLLGAATVVAPVYAANVEGPALITSAGQSPGALMVRVLADRAGVQNVFDATAGVDKLAGAKSFIVVIGASMKGLGAAGIDLDDEVARIQALLQRAEQSGISVIAMHVEGAPRRGATSDNLTDLVFQYADYAVVRADGDDDGFFTNLASRYGVTLVKIGATAEAAGALQQLYGN